jgi:hypothetical protein
MNGRWAYCKWQNGIVRRFMRDTARTQAVQQSVLRKRIRLAAESDFGRQHGLASIRSIADFRRQVPIADYEYFRPYVDRVRRGETQALFGPQTQLLMFALTSGTSDKPKYIPVTNHFVQDYKRGWKIWGLKTHADHPDLLHKDYVHLSSDWQKSRTSSGVWCGSISGLAAETRPRIVRRPFIVPPQVGKVDDWASRQYLTLRLSLASRRVGMVITANPLTLIGLAELADREKETLLKDLFDGTLASEVVIPRSVRQHLARPLQQRHRERSRELEQIVSQTGSLYPRDFWPQLSVIAVWMGGAAGAFVPEVRRLYGERTFRDHGLSASEGRMTIPLEDEFNAGLLDYTSAYFEFIPIAEYEGDDPTVLEAHELSEGESYYILLTNSSGLFRYDIQDVVRCVGYKGQAPLLEFLHKGAHCASMTGEKLTEYQVATAVTEGFRDLNRSVQSVMLVPVMGSPPGYVMLVEPKMREYAGALTAKVDTKLAALNCEYEDRLETGRLLPLRTIEVPAGSWESLRDRKIAQRGGSQEQYKHVFLGVSDDIVEELQGRSTATAEV